MSIMIGGAVGATLRFFVYELLKNKTSFYTPTLIVNIVGSFLLGLYVHHGVEAYYDFFVFGVLASFTTFSTFSVDNLKLLMDGKWKKCLIHTFDNVMFCFVAIVFGLNL